MTKPTFKEYFLRREDTHGRGVRSIKRPHNSPSVTQYERQNRRIYLLEKEITSLKEKNKQLEEKNKDLENQIHYIPGNEGYTEALKDFEERLNQ